MKITDILKLVEAPLPDDWDKEVYKSPTSFKEIVDYATDNSTHIASGSSRVAFEIPYSGRVTALKVAKNAKGLRQNMEEVKLLTNNYIQDSGATIPMIDYDTDNPIQ